MSAGDPAKEASDDLMSLAAIGLDAAGLWLEQRSYGFGHACFLAQQAAEKALKALLAASGEDPPRTHDLEALSALVGPLPGVAREMLAALTPWAIAGRYDRASLDASREQAEEAVAQATKVVGAARQALPAGGEGG